MINEVYTFVAAPTGAKNEVIIGATADQTAANLTAVINSTYGAVFTATAIPSSVVVPLVTLNFEGNDGDTSWAEDIQGLTPDTVSGNCELDISQFYDGTSSLRMGDNSYVDYTVPGLESNFSYEVYFRFHDAVDNWFDCCYIYDIDGNFWLEVEFYEDDGNTVLGIWGSDSANNSFESYDEVISISADVWHKFSLSIVDSVITIKIDDVTIREITATIDSPAEGVDGFELANGNDTVGNYVWFDNVVINNGTLISAGISITDYTSDTISKSTTSSGITLSAVTKSITYTSNKASNTIPSFEVLAEGTSWGELGDIYVLSTLAPLTASGTSIMTGNNGIIFMPSFAASGISYMPACNTTSSDADIVNLLRCGDDWMEDFAAMVIVPGDPDDVALQAIQYVHDNLTYVNDLTQYGVADYWVEPRQTLALMQGDCEDGAFLTASLIINSGVDYTRVRVYLGETLGIGHAWVMYRRTIDNQWVILDWVNWNTSVDNVDELDAFYPILFNQFELGEGDSPANDNWAYGSAWAYINCHDKVDLTSAIYLSTMYSNPMLTEIIATMGAITIKANSGGELSMSSPAIELTAHGSSNYLASLTKEIARISLTASAHSGENGNLYSRLPAVRVSSSGDMDNTGTLEKALPYIKLTSSAINGLISGLSKSIPSVKITSSAYWLAGATIDISIPYLRLNARAENSDILAILMNTKNFALTEYVNYKYNSLGFFNGKMVGAKSTGIYELTGDDDDGENIEWSFKTGKLDMDDTQVKKARHVWLSYNPSGDLILVVDDGENEYEYEVESVKQIDNAVRVKLGKGIRNRFLQFELKNVANEKINLDRMRIFAEPIGKKR